MSTTYSFDFSNGEAPFTTWMSSNVIPASDGGGTRVLLPGDIDPNHIDGIGPLYLLAHLSLPTVGAPGVMDLRDATISLNIRAEDFDSNGAKLVVWVCTYVPATDISDNFPFGQLVTNWAYTAVDLSPILEANQSDGQYHNISFTLDPDPSNWTYAGNNVSSQGDWAQRYTYLDLEKTLSRADATLHFVLIGNKPDEKPTGFIDIHDIAVTTNTPAIPSAAQLNAQIFSGLEDTPLTGTLMPESSGLTFSLVPNSDLRGSVSLDSATGEFTFIPDPDFFGPTDVNGAARFQYTYSDGTTTSVPQTVTLFIGPIDDPPTATTANEDVAIQSNKPFTFTLFRGTDIDERAQFSFKIVDGSSVGGTVSLDSRSGVYTFTPSSGFTGAASFSYTLSDGFNDAQPKTVHLTVTDSAPPLPSFADIDAKLRAGDIAGGIHDEILLAQSGNPVGAYHYGAHLKYGVLVNKDTQLAASFLRQAVGLIDDASLLLADLYIQGDGVTRDYGEARALLTALPNSDVAHYRLGLLDDLGFGLPDTIPDHVSAAAHYLKSAKLGNSYAMFSLGRQYLEGSGVRLDYQDAYFWLGTARKYGMALAPSNILAIVEYDLSLAAAHLSHGQIAALNNAIGKWSPGSSSLFFVGDTSDNIIRGGPTQNYLVGYAGNDTLDDGRGVSALQGGLGNDVYIVRATGDTITEFANEGTDTVWTHLASFTLKANLENLTFVGSGIFTGIGNDLDNIMIGGSDDDRLFGGKGADYLIGQVGNDTLDGGSGEANNLQGGVGNDTYIISAVGDSITELANEGTDVVQIALGSFTLPSNVENLTHTGNSQFFGAGNDLRNVLIGGGGNDYLVGYGGNDTLIDGLGLNTLQGGPGDDIYAVQSSMDTVLEFFSEGTDQVQTFLPSYTLRANVENLTFVGSASHVGKGNALDNVMTGGSGNDQLIGLDGNDTFIDGLGSNVFEGGNGDDTYICQLTTNSIVELADCGNDSVQTMLASFILPANVESLIFEGAFSHTGTGNELDNVFSGGSAADTFTGSGGNDVFSYRTSGNGLDTIIDFNTDNANTAEHDQIDLQGRGLSFGELAVTTVSAGITVGIPGGDAIYLKGITASSLDAGDFFF